MKRIDEYSGAVVKDRSHKTDKRRSAMRVNGIAMRNFEHDKAQRIQKGGKRVRDGRVRTAD